MDGFDLINTGWLSILPPVIAITLALISKEVFSSLLVGIFSGMLIYSLSAGQGVIEAVINVPRMMAEQISGNGYMILFLALLGALVVVVTMAGGSRAYGNWARKRIKSARGAKLLTALLGVIIFIDDYFNCLTVGTVMRPVTDRFGVSREKLSYLIDSTAAPICIIAPISSWAAAVASKLGGDGGFTAFLRSIPFNLYAILTIVMVFFICMTGFDFGAMRKAEQSARAGMDDEDTSADFDGIKASDKGSVLDLVIPIIALIIFSIMGMLYAGGFFSGDLGFVDAIGEDPTFGLCLGAFAALIVAFVMYIPRKLMNFKEYMSGVTKGVGTMVPAIMILVFAWSLSGVCRYMIGTGEFVSGVVASSNFPLSLLPAVIFIIAAFLSFSTGTAWGTFGILLPIVISICANDGGAAYIYPAMGATLAGSVYGDHCSPISDTTILSSTGAKCEHIKHVSTQIPYATFVAVVCFVGYIVAGLTRNALISVVVSLAIMFAAFWVISKMQKKSKVNAK